METDRLNDSESEAGVEMDEALTDKISGKETSSEPRLSDPNSNVEIKKKKNKPKEAGIVYLSYIPPLMNVKKVRELFSDFGELGRVFLQPDRPSKKGKPSKFFSEGWVEFKDKRIAKKVTLFLNGKQIGGKRKCPWYDSLWSIKYLHGFKWTHLSEKLSYERAVHEQKLRNEISQAKKESNFYARTVENTQRVKRKKARGDTVFEFKPSDKPVYQKLTDNQMREKSNNNKEADKTLLRAVFGGESD